MLGKGWSGVNESKRMTAEDISKAHLLTTAEVVSRCALAWGGQTDIYRRMMYFMGVNRMPFISFSSLKGTKPMAR